MIELKSLTFNNIRRFVEEQTIDFSDRDKLVQVDGKNLNTGGSSGAGKTSIFMALDYLLGISDIPSTVLQSRLTKESLSVTGNFSVDGKPLVVTRSKKNGLSIDYDDEKVTGNVKLAEERLEEIIGIPRSVFKKMIHKKQKEGGFFINMTGKEIYGFLTTVLGLDKYQAYLSEITSHTAADVKKIDDLGILIQLEKANIKDLERMLGEKEKPKKTVTQKEIDFVEKQITDLQSKKSALDAECSVRLSSLVEPVQNFIGFDKSKYENIQLEVQVAKKKLLDIELARKAINEELSKFPMLKEKAIQCGQKIASLKSDKAEIEKAVCPTCAQGWVGETAKAKIESINNEIDQATSFVLDIKHRLDQKSEVEQKASRLDQMYLEVNNALENLSDRLVSEKDRENSHNMQQRAKYTEELKAFSSKKSEIEKEYEGRLNTFKESIQMLQVDLSSKKKELELYLQSVKTYEAEVAKLAQLILDKKTLVDKAEKDKANLEEKILVAQEAKRLIKNYTLQTFQETLDSIGDMSTEILSGIPNMANSTIYFEGCKENKDGSIKDEVTGIINMDGESIPIKSLSGGERTAIDLAVDLAVIDVIETKAGKGANFYIIDEPFDGLDAVCRENCLEILKQIDTNKKIIMVDHSTELKEMVADIITVIRDGEFSTIAN